MQRTPIWRTWSRSAHTLLKKQDIKPPEVKEGAAPQGVYVMLAFDSLADAEKWYSTSPYADLIPERQKSAKSNVFIIEGLPQ